MARPPKYDWIKLKEDWLLSELNELSDFFANLNTPIPKHTYKTNAKGWREEKEAFKEKLSSAKIGKALQDPEIGELKEKILTRQEAILAAKDNIITKLSLLFGGENSVIEKSEVKEAIAVLNALKTELGETTTIGKNKIEGAGENGRIEILRRIIEMP